MKTSCFLPLVVSFSLVIAFAYPVSAHDFYFDIGLGVDKLNGQDFAKLVKATGGNVNEIAFDFGFKVGYGPIADKPLYIVGEVGRISYEIERNSKYIQFNSHLIGPGVIFYPMPLIQLGASIGYSFISNSGGLRLMSPDDPDYDESFALNTYSEEKVVSYLGAAWNISAAVDLGGGNNGCLVGFKYFSATNEIKTLKVKPNSSMIGIFIKIRYAAQRIM